MAEQAIRSAEGMLFATDVPFYAFLARAALTPPRPPGAPRSSGIPSRPPLDAPAEHLRRLEIWADACPANYRHKYLLVEAEVARMTGDDLAAMALYDEAIEAAWDNDCSRDEALANELCARFHLQQGRRKIARGYMTDAYYGYLRWGATAKTDDIARDHPDLLVRAAAPRAEGTAPLSAGALPLLALGVEHPNLLDVATIIRATSALAEEIILDRLLTRLLRIVVESAGAQRGVLLLDREGRLTVEAVMDTGAGVVERCPAIPAEQSAEIPLSIVHYAARTRGHVVLGDATRGGRFAADPYVLAREPKSILCVPLTHHGGVTGVLYLENNAGRDAFSPSRVELLRVLSSQAAIAVRNALLYARVQAMTDELRSANEVLEAEVARRTEQLSEANADLARELRQRTAAERERAALQEQMIQAQRTRLAELSTPLLPITDRIMVMPLLGAMDAERAQQALETALYGAYRNLTEVMILDITGVKGVDAGVAGMLVRTAEALRRLGTEAIITGIQPDVARTLIALGLDLGGIPTLSTLQSGIAAALTATEGSDQRPEGAWERRRRR
jgi:GAF domain-containing protein